MIAYSILNLIPKDYQNIDWKTMLLSGSFILLQMFLTYIIYVLMRASAGKLIQTGFAKIQLRKNVSPGRALTLESLIRNTTNYVLAFLLIVTLLQLVGIKTTAILAGAGVAGLAVGFGAQGLVSDVVTGFFLLLEKQLDVGDYVTIGSFSGVVEQLGLKTTIIRGMDGTLHYLPNRQITSLSNHSRGNMRALVDISIDSSADLDLMTELIEDACREVSTNNEDSIIEGPNVLSVQEFDSSNMVIRVLAKTVNGKQGEIERQLRVAIKRGMVRQPSMNIEN
ncbi:mechanosensitive ion channel family protein [Peribacillus sp. FSL H8-0477]|uniref:mechanosensitive ion channel family protein n=1 Tax=Peribacillus sp. FSL H8-0477 TaxID=2921388 RepID=UPI0030FCDCBC